MTRACSTPCHSAPCAGACRPRGIGLRRSRRGAVYVEVIVAIIPVLIFFLGLLQLAMIFSAHLVVRHAATRAVRSAVVVLDDDPEHYAQTERGLVTYHDPNGGSGSSTLQYLQDLGDVFGIKMPTNEIGNLLNSQAGPRLSAIEQAAYMPLAVLAPTPDTLLKLFGMGNGTLSQVGNGGRFLMGFLLYNHAAAMITLRNADGAVATSIPSDGLVTVRVTYLYFCAVPIVNYFMCDSMLKLSGLDQLDDAARSAYESVSQGGIEGVRGVKDQLHTDLQKISDKVGNLARDLQYAESPEFLLPFLSGRGRFKMMSAEMTLPNQGACYYAGSSCFAATPPDKAAGTNKAAAPAPAADEDDE
jgi:hypothetical protein